MLGNEDIRKAIETFINKLNSAIKKRDLTGKDLGYNVKENVIRFPGRKANGSDSSEGNEMS